MWWSRGRFYSRYFGGGGRAIVGGDRWYYSLRELFRSRGRRTGLPRGISAYPQPCGRALRFLNLPQGGEKLGHNPQFSEGPARGSRRVCMQSPLPSRNSSFGFGIGIACFTLRNGNSWSRSSASTYR